MERLDLRLVEYFVAVAEELHFGRAAERLHIAQPSLSQQIRRLESQLGVTLLKRNSRHVELTSAGQALLREGRKTLSQASRAIHAARAAGSPSLTVGFYGSAAGSRLPDVLHAFGERHPSLTVTVRELQFGSIDAILTGEVDIAFTRLAPGQTELEVEVLGQESRLVALATAHPLASRESVNFADLREESFITNPMGRDEGAQPHTWLAEQRRHGLQGRVAAQTAGIAEILTLVGAGRGVCLVPATVAQQYPRGDVVYVPVEDADPALISIARRPGTTSPAVAEFIETVRRLYLGEGPDADAIGNRIAGS
jgi:DNA-binding transcriptional LysR family regulator